MTISWTDAYWNALKFVVYSIIWDIIGGGIILFTLYNSISLSMFSTGINYKVIFSFVLFLIGLIFITLGNLATFLKIFGDTIADEVERRQIKQKS